MLHWIDRNVKIFNEPSHPCPTLWSSLNGNATTCNFMECSVPFTRGLCTRHDKKRAYFSLFIHNEHFNPTQPYLLKIMSPYLLINESQTVVPIPFFVFGELRAWVLWFLLNFSLYATFYFTLGTKMKLRWMKISSKSLVNIVLAPIISGSYFDHIRAPFHWNDQKFVRCIKQVTAIHTYLKVREENERKS